MSKWDGESKSAKKGGQRVDNEYGGVNVMRSSHQQRQNLGRRPYYPGSITGVRVWATCQPNNIKNI